MGTHREYARSGVMEQTEAAELSQDCPDTERLPGREGALGPSLPSRELYLPGAPEVEEWVRWALDSRSPGLMVGRFRQSGAIAEYPEIAALIDVPQDPEWHPEGPVDVHTCHVLNAAAEIASREGLEREERLILVLSALSHDFGKAHTTQLRRKGHQMRWTSYGHEAVGGPIAARFLRRIGFTEELIGIIVPLVKNHMAYRDYRETHTGARTVRRLAQRLAPATLRQLGYLIEADHSGRPPLPKQLPDAAKRMLKLAEKSGVLDGVGS